LAGLFHHAAIDFDGMQARGPQCLKGDDGTFTIGGPVVVQSEDGSIADVDAMTTSLADLLGNASTFSASRPPRPASRSRQAPRNAAASAGFQGHGRARR